MEFQNQQHITSPEGSVTEENDDAVDIELQANQQRNIQLKQVCFCCSTFFIGDKF